MEIGNKINSEELLGNASVLNTSIGIRLIDDMSKTDPVKACDCMMNAFGKAADENLKNIRDNRRELCWTLSRLCFYGETFEKAAFLMLRFAETESEEELGNARIGLQKLFFPKLGATEADLNRRFGFIKERLCKPENISITLRVLDCATSFQAAFFYDGTEKLADKDMKPYTPTVEEVHDYEASVQELLLYHAANGNEDVKGKALEILGGHFIEQCRYGLAEVTIPTIEKACEIRGNDWDALLDTLLLFKDEMENGLSPKLYGRYVKLIKNLSKDDFEFRFKRVEKDLYNSSLSISTEKIIGEQNARYKGLAEEFISQGLLSKTLLSKLYDSEVISTSPFGEVVARGLTEEQKNAFIAYTVEIMNGRAQSQSDILIDFTVGLNDEEFGKQFEQLLKLKNKRPVFVAVARRSESFNNCYMDVLLDLVKNGDAPAEYLVSFWSSFRFVYMVDEDIASWMRRVRELPDGTQTVLHILQSAITGEAYQKNAKTVEVAIETVMTMEVDNQTVMGYYQYWNVVRLLLSRGRYPELARHINTILLEYVKSHDDFLINNYEVKQTYRQLLSNYFDEVWGDLSAVLLSDGENYWTYHRLKTIMGSMIGGAHNEVGLLFETDQTEALMDWCKDNPTLAPERLMEMAPVFGDNNGFSKVVYALINTFGQNVNVLNALTHNLGCFGWVGSVIPLYEKELKAVETLKDHPIEEVRNWCVRMIEYLRGEMEKEA